jgi:hypothetical protein
MKDVFGVSLAEASTWRSLIVLLTLVGIELSPEQAEAIGKAGAALFVVFGVFTKHKSSVG